MIDERLSTSEDADEQDIDFSALFLKYFYYWRWFLASIIVCCALAFVYIRFQTPVYQVSSSILIKEDEKKAAPTSSPLASIQEMGMLSMTSKFDNEIEILKSRTLVKKVVNDLGLYIELSKPRSMKYAEPLYKNAPLQVYMSPLEAEKLQSPVSMDLSYSSPKSLTIVAEYKEGEEDKVIEKTFSKLPAVLPTSVGVITISLADSTARVSEPILLKATINNSIVTAMNYVANMSVNPSSKTTTIAKLNVKNTVKARGVDFINCLIANYNRDANDEKNEVAQNTAEFINERIGIINSELGTTENKLADFKQKSGLTNLTSDAQMALQENSKYEQQRTENTTQIRLVQFLSTYIDDPSNRDEVLPANVGLKDPNLTAVINQYNSMIMERNRLLRTSSENNPAVIHMNTGIEAMRHNVRTTVSSVLKGLEITQGDIARQAHKFEARISNAPKQEKEFISISRQQEIQAALYIMLLEKREENAITLASTANNGRIIEEPMELLSPVAPKKMVILMIAFALGLVIPILVILIIDLTRYKIENSKDVEALTKLPILGALPLSQSKPVEGAIVLQEDKNDIMEETFRAFRTNLLFMMEHDEKVILLTSTQPGEGKSFITGNLATSLAYLGKKVLVMSLDIRKPGLNKVFNLSQQTKGITDYLVDPKNIDLFSLVQHSTLSDNLDIILGGVVPPNPTELVARESLDMALEKLKTHYDYILLDTAPIAMVTDTTIIARVADICVYVCRANVTPKSDFEYVNKLSGQKNFPKLAIAINAIDVSKRKNNYGKHYGYGYGYGYGKQK